MKKIYAAVTFLIALAVTESCCKQQIDDQVALGQKTIKQSPHANAHIGRP